MHRPVDVDEIRKHYPHEQSRRSTEGCTQVTLAGVVVVEVSVSSQVIYAFLMRSVGYGPARLVICLRIRLFSLAKSLVHGPFQLLSVLNK